MSYFISYLWNASHCRPLLFFSFAVILCSIVVSIILIRQRKAKNSCQFKLILLVILGVTIPVVCLFYMETFRQTFFVGLNAPKEVEIDIRAIAGISKRMLMMGESLHFQLDVVIIGGLFNFVEVILICASLFFFFWTKKKRNLAFFILLLGAHVVFLSLGLVRWAWFVLSSFSTTSCLSPNNYGMINLNGELMLDRLAIESLIGITLVFVIGYYFFVRNNEQISPKSPQP